MRLKATIVGALASALAFSAASAADLPSMKSPPVYAPPIWNWTGWHIGVSGGYGGGAAAIDSNSWIFTPPFAAVAANTSANTSGFLVGVQSGFTWQFANNYVVGYESEFNYADVRSSNGGAFGLGAGRVGIEWFGAERVRFGYAMGRILPYITGGLAYGRFRDNQNNLFGGFLLPSNVSKWHAGWTVGAGVEYAMWDKLSIKAEYLFSRIDGPAGTGVAPGIYSSFRVREFDTHIARVGLNYQIKNFGELVGMPGLGI